MHIHAGNRIVVSDKKIIGIFNTETILMSELNNKFFDKLKPGDKTVVIDRTNNTISTGVSPFTVIKRTELKCEFAWRRKNDSLL
ncbi:MAG: hypothetical protein V1874_07290 [Spirochaetota bacterium]